MQGTPLTLSLHPVFKGFEPSPTPSAFGGFNTWEAYWEQGSVVIEYKGTYDIVQNYMLYTDEPFNGIQELDEDRIRSTINDRFNNQ